MYLPWSRAIGQQFKTCLVVHEGEWHRGQDGEILNFHLERVVGVGRQSMPALAMKERWPVGRLVKMRPHIPELDSRAVISNILYWTLKC